MDTESVSPKVAIYERLREAVTSEELPAGSRISEADLGGRFNVSRTPIREALARLEQDGLIERRGSGLYVRSRSADETLDIYRVRVYLEGAIAWDAAFRRSQTDLMRLEAAAAACEAFDGTEDPVELQQANAAFHQALAVASHNQTLQELQDRLTGQVTRLPSTTLSFPGRWRVAVQEHRALADAVRAQDGETARSIGEAHMNAASEIRSKLIAQELMARS